jgi:hypothetical protein
LHFNRAYRFPRELTVRIDLGRFHHKLFGAANIVAFTEFEQSM